MPVPIPVARTAETGITRPGVFIQQHHEHSPLAYSNPAGLKEGTLIRYGVDRRKNHLYSQISNDGGRTWGEDKFECSVLPGTYMVLPLLGRDGEMHLASMVGRGDGQQIAVDRFIDIWHQRTAREQDATRHGSRVGLPHPAHVGQWQVRVPHGSGCRPP